MSRLRLRRRKARIRHLPLVGFVAPARLKVYRKCTAFSDFGCPMKVRASVRRICDKCKLIKRKGVVRVICEDPRHKQRQG